MTRLTLNYTAKVEIPERFKNLFWDEKTNFTFLEKFILRILKYGNFEDINWLYAKYHQEVEHIVFKYSDIKRGIKFWIKRWKKQ